jgi:hypothetical protein
MLRKIVRPMALAAVLASAPAAAQDVVVTDPLATFAQAFPVEPLTAEQEARLPQAQAVVDKIIPPGAMKNMMGSLFDGVLQPLMAIGAETTAADAAELLGVEVDQIELGDEQAAEIVRIVDPAHGERAARTAKAMPSAMNRLVAAAEPGMRKAMSEAYAIYFDGRELADISAFFDTPSGAAYARKSMSMAGDARYIGAMMQSMPDMTTYMGEIEAVMAAAVADLPAAKGYADLTADERTRLAELTGLDEVVIQAAMEAAVLDGEVPSEDE